MAVGIDLHLTDDATIASAAAYAESIAVGLAEPTPNLVILTQVAASDDAVLGATDNSGSPALLLTAIETLATGLTDAIAILFNSTEGIPLHATDTAQVVVVATVTDSLTLAGSELPAIGSAQATADTIGLGLTDASPAVPLVIPVTDSLQGVLVEGAPTLNTGLSSTAFVSVTDSALVGLTDIHVSSVLTTSASESLAMGSTTPGFGEDIVIFGFVPQQFVQVSVVDVCVVEVETPLLAQGIGVSDGLTINAVDTTPSSLPSLSVVEAIRVGVGESQPSVTPAISASDMLTIQPIEPEGIFSAWGLADQTLVGGTESAPGVAGSFSFTASDTIPVQAGESAPTFLLNQPVAATDSLATQASEGGQLIAVAARAAETLGITLNEAASLLLKFLLITDSLGIGVADAASLFNDFIQLSASDSNAVQQSDLVVVLDQVLTQLSTSDTLAVRPQEEIGVGTSVSTRDVFGVALLDNLALALTYALADTLAFAAQAENANVINPFVVNVFVFAADAASLTATDVPTAPIQLLMLTVADDCTVETDDLSLSEDRPLPDILDAHQGLSYDTLVPDPVSYRMSPQRTW